MEAKEFIEKVQACCETLIKEFKAKKKENAVIAYHRFNEYLLRLHSRHEALSFVESLVIHADPDEMEKRNVTLAELQLEFVDKTEAFHQQVYATISAFILLLTHVADNKITAQIPISSVTKFIRFCSDNSYDSILKDQAAILGKSVDFRSKFIDHPQQHVLHDWMTYSYMKGTCIIYFIRKGDEVYHRGIQDPYAHNFQPPVNCKSFYVSPPHRDVFNALIHFADRKLQSLGSEKQ